MNSVSPGAKQIPKTASPANTSDEWFENFDDGDFSDWTILNPEKSGDQPITLVLATNQSHSPQYSMFLNSPHTGNPDYSARAYGPNVIIDLDQPHTIEFWFRWNDFHWVHFAGFGYLATLIDNPYLPMNFMDDEGYHYLGPAFSSYCPKNTWTHFKFEVEPSVSNITLYVNDIFIITFNYEMKAPDETKFNIRDPGAGANDYFDHCYYDDIKVEGTSALIYITILSPQDNSWHNNDVTISGMAQSKVGTITNVSLVIEGGYERYATINGINWNYVWDSTGRNGKHTITAYCKDSSGNTEHSFPITCYIDNTPPNITLGYPQEGIPCTFGRSWLALYHFIPHMPHIKLITGAVNFIPGIMEFGSGIDYVKFELFDERLNDVVGEHKSDEYPYTWYCDVKVFGLATLTIRATDEVGNIGVHTYTFFKIF